MEYVKITVLEFNKIFIKGDVFHAVFDWFFVISETLESADLPILNRVGVNVGVNFDNFLSRVNRKEVLIEIYYIGVPEII